MLATSVVVVEYMRIMEVYHCLALIREEWTHTKLAAWIWHPHTVNMAVGCKVERGYDHLY